MSIACQKQYQLTVNPVSISPDAYWTLDEAAGNRIDKVNATALVPGGGGILEALPALFSNGVGFPEKGAGLSNLANTAVSTLAPQGGGWSWWFWFNVQNWPPTIPAPWNIPPTMLFGDPGFGPGAAYRITIVWDPTDTNLFCQDGLSLNTVGTQWSDNSGNIYCGAPLPVTTGIWYFMHMFYDSVAGKVGYQVNHGSLVYATQGLGPPANPTFAGPNRNGQLNIAQQWVLADTATVAVIIDEMGFKLSRMLTDSEVAYLYNAGNGRTWPL